MPQDLLGEDLMASQGMADRASIGASGEDVPRAVCRVDFDDDGHHVDDVAISGELILMFRLEAMDRDQFWGAVYMRDGRDLRFWFDGSKARSLKVTAEWEGRALTETPPSQSEAKLSAATARLDEPLLAPVLDREEGLGSSVGRADRGSIDWLPISSAPRDGTPILVFFNRPGLGVQLVSWTEPEWADYKLWCVDDNKHGPYPLRGYLDEDVTHWMPLPSGPFDPVRAGADAPSNGEGGVA